MSLLKIFNPISGYKSGAKSIMNSAENIRQAFKINGGENKNIKEKITRREFQNRYVKARIAAMVYLFFGVMFVSSAIYIGKLLTTIWCVAMALICLLYYLKTAKTLFYARAFYDRKNTIGSKERNFFMECIKNPENILPKKLN